jgi:hypothetical protein
VFKAGPRFYTNVPSRAVCDFFKLENLYREIGAHPSLEDLVDRVYFNQYRSLMEIYVVPIVLESKPYLKNELVT